VREFVLNGVEGAWLDDSEKAALRREFTGELDRLESELRV
jgi:adenosine deaminase